MRKLASIIFVVFIFLTALFCSASFFIHKVIIIENKPNLSYNPLALEIEEVKPAFLNFFEEIKEKFISNKTDFLEANLAEMKIRIYKEGSLIEEVPILKKGDPQSWGGSAVGLYKIISGGTASFSNASEVYMPHALHYYGKYYFHGEPYYPGGEELDSAVSGGCLRLDSKDAKAIYELAEIDMPVLVIDKERENYEYLNGKLSDFPEVFSQSYLVADLDSGYVFAEKDSLEELPIASLTKLMTATVIAENVNLEDSILVREEMLDAYGSTEGLEAEKRFGVVELFYPLLIESSNDAAEVLSYFLGKDKTIELMNDKAKSILMSRTKFVEPSGFNPQNVSTARDLFYLIRYIFNNRFPILELTRGKKVSSFGEVDFKIEDLWNKNIFISDPNFIGGKTGYIKESKQTAIFIFRFIAQDNSERNIAIILLRSASTKIDTQRIYRWLQENYSLSPII